MRPNRLKSKKIINIKNKKKKRVHKKKNIWGSTGIQTADLDNINLVLYKNKKRIAKENLGCSWNVVPKDSCEIYKKRYRRQKEGSGRDYGNRTNNTDDSEESNHQDQKSSRNSKKRCNCRQRRRRSVSKCSQFSTSETSSVNSSKSETTN